MTRMAQARTEVEQAFEAVMSVVERSDVGFAAFEKELWSRMLALGRALVVLFLARRPAPSGDYMHSGKRYEMSGERRSELGTLFGKVEFVRSIGRRVGAPRAAADLPIDRELGLKGGFSLGVVMAMTRLCAQMAYANARETFEQTHEWSPAPRSVTRMVDAVGGEARGFLESAPAPAEDGEILVIQVDGKGAPMITSSEFEKRARKHQAHDGTRRAARRTLRRSRTEKRRGKGEKSKNAKIAVVGAIYTLKRTEKGIEGPIEKRLLATFESYSALFEWLKQEAAKRGYGSKRTLFLADGADVIWRLQEAHFPLAEACIDWCHVVEKLWHAGEALFGERTPALSAWIDRQEERLHAGQVPMILADLRLRLTQMPKTGPGNKGRRKALNAAVSYLETHAKRIRYSELREDDLDIGSGVIEGAVRNLVGMRLDGPGMRWSRQRSEHVMHLRCVLLNKQWHDFEKHLTASQFNLKPQPQRTLTYDAIRKAA